MMACRYVDGLVEAHDAEHLTKFEELLEAAIDLDRIPDEYLICASYDAGLKVDSRTLLAECLPRPCHPAHELCLLVC